MAADSLAFVKSYKFIQEAQTFEIMCFKSMFTDIETKCSLQVFQYNISEVILDIQTPLTFYFLVLQKLLNDWAKQPLLDRIIRIDT